MVSRSHTVHDTIATNEPDSPEAVQAIRDYVGSPLFRSARIEELVIDDNPYRRPVRPEDMEWLRFSQPINAETSASLSALLGHRMLLSIYDSGRNLLPKSMTEERWRDFKEFYGDENRARGERIRPLLEHHLFQYVRQAAEERDILAHASSSRAAGRLLRDLASDFDEQLNDVHKIETDAAHLDPVRRTVVIQVIGQRLAGPLRLTAPLVVRCLGFCDESPGSFTAGVSVGHLVRADQSAEKLASQYELGWRPHQYFQFYLPTTLALMNYLARRRRDPRDVFCFVGAMAARTVCTQGLYDGLMDEQGVLDRSGSLEGTLAWLRDCVVEPIEKRFGAPALREFVRGALEYATLANANYADLTQQLRWLDADQEYQEKARRLESAISDYQIPVALDTFVESWEECSTAHVHDDDRLVVVERGEMVFWNCFGEMHKFGPGDAMYVPRHRLHGSVVMSGTCVYHQPIITADLNLQYG